MSQRSMSAAHRGRPPPSSQPRTPVRRPNGNAQSMEDSSADFLHNQLHNNFPASIYTPPGMRITEPEKYVLLAPTDKKKMNDRLGPPEFWPITAASGEEDLTAKAISEGFIEPVALEDESGTMRTKFVHFDLGNMKGKLLQGVKEIEWKKTSSMRREPKGIMDSAVLNGIPKKSRFPTLQPCNKEFSEKWIKGLASSEPLHKLSNKVPHGFKGDVLLRTLMRESVPIIRATWFIKIILLNNNQKLEWTNNLVQFLLQEMNGVIKHQKSYNAEDTEEGIQNYHQTMMKMRQDMEYIIKLILWNYQEGLLNNESLLSKLVDVFGECNNLEQLGLVSSMMPDYLPDLCKSHRNLARRLVTYTTEKWLQITQHMTNAVKSETVGSTLTPFVRQVCSCLQNTLRYILMDSPDHIACMDGKTLNHIFSITKPNPEDTTEPGMKLTGVYREGWEHQCRLVEESHETHHCLTEYAPIDLQLYTCIDELDQISHTGSHSLQYEDLDSQISSILSQLKPLLVPVQNEKGNTQITPTERLVSFVCEWGTNKERVKHTYRRYLCVRLLREIAKQQNGVEEGENNGVGPPVLQKYLYHYLEQVGQEREEVMQLFTQLIQEEKMFSHDQYARTLISTGALNKMRSQGADSSSHSYFLVHLPVSFHPEQSSHTLHEKNQRKAALRMAGMPDRENSAVNVIIHQLLSIVGDTSQTISYDHYQVIEQVSSLKEYERSQIVHSLIAFCHKIDLSVVHMQFVTDLLERCGKISELYEFASHRLTRGGGETETICIGILRKYRQLIQLYSEDLLLSITQVPTGWIQWTHFEVLELSAEEGIRWEHQKEGSEDSTEKEQRGTTISEVQLIIAGEISRLDVSKELSNTLQMKSSDPPEGTMSKLMDYQMNSQGSDGELIVSLIQSVMMADENLVTQFLHRYRGAVLQWNEQMIDVIFKLLERGSFTVDQLSLWAISISSSPSSFDHCGRFLNMMFEEERKRNSDYISKSTGEQQREVITWIVRWVTSQTDENSLSILNQPRVKEMLQNNTDMVHQHITSTTVTPREALLYSLDGCKKTIEDIITSASLWSVHSSHLHLLLTIGSTKMEEVTDRIAKRVMEVLGKGEVMAQEKESKTRGQDRMMEKSALYCKLFSLLSEEFRNSLIRSFISILSDPRLHTTYLMDHLQGTQSESVAEGRGKEYDTATVHFLSSLLSITPSDLRTEFILSLVSQLESVAKQTLNTPVMHQWINTRAHGSRLLLLSPVVPLIRRDPNTFGLERISSSLLSISCTLIQQGHLSSNLVVSLLEVLIGDVEGGSKNGGEALRDKLRNQMKAEEVSPAVTSRIEQSLPSLSIQHTQPNSLLPVNTLLAGRKRVIEDTLSLLEDFPDAPLSPSMFAGAVSFLIHFLFPPDVVGQIGEV
ncbi:hypothetical protein PROFUN_10841 [Planoprotostelium fungivorum]|uniref:Mediator complex subunit Med12 domain-containing protein n=1 Tax=Planoprotostelium fungivorum TaxID=1890364 RepID=A0A2P6NCR4_9EUKA|nr:hypothetical protein PROFUN_10841 [Planoprotostelium fungivorum]